MDEQTAHAADELDIVGDEASDTAADDTKEQDTDSKDEQKRDALDLEGAENNSSKEKSKAEAVRDQQVEKWAKVIASGDKSLDDMPANLKWLKPLVEAKLGINAPEDLDKKVEEIVNKKDDERKLKALVEDLNATLSKSKKIELKEKRDFFLSKGLSRLDAYEAAMVALNIDLEESRLDARRKAARLRTPGNYKAMGKATSIEAVHAQEGFAAVAQQFTPEQVTAYLKSLKGVK